MEGLRPLGRRWGHLLLLAGIPIALGSNEALRRTLTTGLRVAALTALNMAAGEAIFSLLCLLALTRAWLLVASAWLRIPHARTPVDISRNAP